MITGRSGNMHGARTVNIPAINAIIRSTMFFIFLLQTQELPV